METEPLPFRIQETAGNAFSGKYRASCRKCNGGHRAQWSRKNDTIPLLMRIGKRCKGILEKDGTSYSSKQRLKLCYMVMQDVNHQLFTESVLEEVLLSMPGKDSDESPENVAKAEAILTEMDLLPYKACHPMGLSGGQKTTCGDCFCDCL